MTGLAKLDYDALTDRELDVLRLVADGLSNKDIASSLWLTEQTIKFHASNAYRKLGVRNRMAAVVVARERGLLGEAAARELCCPHCGAWTQWVDAPAGASGMIPGGDVEPLEGSLG